MRFVVLIPLLLAACSVGNMQKDGPGRAAADALRSRFAGADTTAPTPTLTRAMLAAQTEPLIRVSLAKVGFSALAVQSDRDGPVITFASANGQSFAYRGGVLIATRGLGPDLMALSAPRPGGGPYARTSRRLDGENHMTGSTVTCTATRHGRDDQVIVGRRHALVRISEDCKGPEGEYDNVYWADPVDGTIWKSRQWLNPDLGYLQTELLVVM